MNSNKGSYNTYLSAWLQRSRNITTTQSILAVEKPLDLWDYYTIKRDASYSWHSTYTTGKTQDPQLMASEKMIWLRFWLNRPEIHNILVSAGQCQKNVKARFGSTGNQSSSRPVVHADRDIQRDVSDAESSDYQRRSFTSPCIIGCIPLELMKMTGCFNPKSYSCNFPFSISQLSQCPFHGNKVVFVSVQGLSGKQHGLP